MKAWAEDMWWRFCLWFDEASGRAGRRRRRAEMIEASTRNLAAMMRAEATRRVTKSLVIHNVMRDIDKRQQRKTVH